MTQRLTEVLVPGFDKATGSVVLHNAAGDIRLFVSDGKMQVVRKGAECPDCIAANMRLAERIAALSAQQEGPAAPDASATEGGARWQADQHLRALLRYTENFYGAAIQHGMKAGETANAIAHIERAGKALHQLVHAWADTAEKRAQEGPAADPDGRCTRCGLAFEDPREVTHECPPGFKEGPAAEPVALRVVNAARAAMDESRDFLTSDDIRVRGDLAAALSLALDDFDRLAAPTQAAEPVARPALTDDAIAAAWKTWPHTSITSAAKAIGFVRHVLAAAPTQEGPAASATQIQGASFGPGSTLQPSVSAAIPGAWVIAALDGRQWAGESPVRAAAAAQRDTIDPVLAMQRINAIVDEENAIRDTELTDAYAEGRADERAETRRVLRKIEQSHTGMCYGDEKRGGASEYARGWGDCLAAFKAAAARGTECASTETAGLGPQGERPGPKDAPKTEGAASAPVEPQDALLEHVQEALRDMLAGWTYIRGFHGDLYGVGWDRAQAKAEAAMAAIDAARSTAPAAKGEG